MKIFLRKTPRGLSVKARPEAEDGTVGDLSLDLSPGGSFLGHTFDELAALGDGGHDVEPKGDTPAD